MTAVQLIFGSPRYIGGAPLPKEDVMTKYRNTQDLPCFRGNVETA